MMKKRILHLIPYLFVMVFTAQLVGCQEEFSKVIPDQSSDSVDVVYGSPNTAVIEALDGFGAKYMAPIGGFRR